MGEPIRMDEVLAELTRLQAEGGPDVPGFTRNDFMAALGIGESAAQKKLREMHTKGLIEFAGRRTTLRMDGIRCQVPVYRVKAAPA